MKNITLPLLLAVFFSIAVFFSTPSFGQCEPEPALEKIGKILSSATVEIEAANNETWSAANELFLSLTARADGASWQLKGAESPVLTIFVDGKYNQDLILFAGAEKLTYRVALGKFGKGRHKVAIALNEARSAPNAGRVKIHSQEFSTAKDLAKNSKRDSAALANSPVIYARPNTIDKFTDIPLVTYYEIFQLSDRRFKIRYTTIFSNEDGGTETTALMARWGRATDIEWVYEVELQDDKIVAETYQGANHETKHFRGKRDFGSHPLIYTVTDNNNFSDMGCSSLRAFPFPIRADLSDRSRETLMDENPWTYRVMAQELFREGRVDPQNIGINTIDDLRNYLYAEVYSDNFGGAAVAVEAIATDGGASRSDLGDRRLRIERSGYKRIAVRLPSSSAPLESLSMICQPAADPPHLSGCRNSRIIKYIRLDEKYRVIVTRNSEKEGLSLGQGEKLTWRLIGR